MKKLSLKHLVLVCAGALAVFGLSSGTYLVSPVVAQEQQGPSLKIDPTKRDVAVTVKVPWSTMAQVVAANQYYQGGAQVLNVSGYLTDGVVRSQPFMFPVKVVLPDFGEVTFSGPLEHKDVYSVGVGLGDFTHHYNGGRPVHLVLDPQPDWRLTPKGDGFVFVWGGVLDGEADATTTNLSSKKK